MGVKIPRLSGAGSALAFVLLALEWRLVACFAGVKHLRKIKIEVQRQKQIKVMEDLREKL